MSKAPMKTSFNRAAPGAVSGATTKTPPPRPPGRPAPLTATTAAPAKSAPPRPPSRAAAPPPPPPVEVETEVVPDTETAPVEETTATAPAAPRPRGRPPGAPNRAKSATSAALAVTPPAQNRELSREVLFTGEAGRVEGDFDQSDFTLPQLKVASGHGPLKLLEPPILDGCLVIGSGETWEYLFAEDWEPLGVTVIRARKSIAQTKNEEGDSLFDLGEQGLEFDTIEEMKAAGGTMQDVKGMKVCEAVLKVHALIRMPDGLENQLGLFDKEIEGVFYAQAMWRIRGSSYRECARKINDEMKQDRFLSGCSFAGEFLATSKYIKSDRNAWWVPILENGEAHTEAFMAVAATL